MTSNPLFEPAALGAITLSNRIVMAPLTRNRAGAGFVPGDLTADYYAQRASAGLIISEATQISQQGQGYQDTPGIYTQAQIDGWRKVTVAVHEKGGRIVLQLWHVGRISHVDLQPNGGQPVAPSAIRAATKTFVNNAFVDVSEPRALEIDKLAGIVDDFRKAAANATEAGFDGVEVHGANGYLLEQFAKDGANVRTDAYGGSVENRARLMLEVTAAVAEEIGAERTGIRISPVSPANGISSSDPRPSTTISSISSMRSASPTFTSSKARPAARATSHPSTTDRCAGASAKPILPTMATISTSRRRIWPMARRISSLSDARSLPIRISWKGCKAARRWLRSIRRRSMAAALRVIPIIPALPRLPALESSGAALRRGPCDADHHQSLTTPRAARPDVRARSRRTLWRPLHQKDRRLQS